jgi:hypothetical protein
MGGKEDRVKTMILLTIISAILLSAVPVFAQRVVDPNELKISPAKYKNQTIKLNDKFILNRAGLSPAMTAAGYTLDKYITFGATGAGMRCFIRRTPALEKLVGELKKGERITIIGTVKQPKAKVKRAGGRVTDRYKLDMYVIEARKLEKGWENN